jgi:hypothetical protein
MFDKFWKKKIGKSDANVTEKANFSDESSHSSCNSTGLISVPLALNYVGVEQFGI